LPFAQDFLRNRTPVTVSISLVISTCNRARQLQACLAYIGTIDTPVPWELIVVDNGSTDTTPEVLQKFAASVSFPVTLLNEPVTGLGRAHNRGWKAARGEVVAFTDDDCYVLPDFLDQALALFADPRIGFCGGRIKLYDVSDAQVTINETTIPQAFPPHSYIRAGAIQGANMIFRKRTLQEIEGFDEAFGPGTPFNCEDIDACARASFAGWWGVYAPGPTVLHAHGRKAVDAAMLWRRYAVGRGAYAAKFILRHDTRQCYLQSWCLQLARHLTGSSGGGYRDCLREIEGAIRYCCHQFPELLRF
jgi:GT2 family glycosyltransferase